ncbi:MAG: carbon-nitrogen hydrolase family protein [Candidatus Aminicenantales bacterium]
MKIALIQQKASRDKEDNLRRGAEAFQRAAREGARLIAFAELGFSYFWPQYRTHQEHLKQAEPIPGPTTEMFTALSKEYGAVTVLNLFERYHDRTFDASPVIDADGSILGVIRMVHIMDGMGFYEKGYYHPGDKLKLVYSTSVGRVGVAICYDRHFPEYMRALALQKAEIVLIPQAGAVGEWTQGIFEAEIQVAAFQNGYFAALVNRVGKEEHLNFAGGSFVVDPEGALIARAPEGEDFILYAECDLEKVEACTARKFFLPDRRPSFYKYLSHKKA